MTAQLATIDTHSVATIPVDRTAVLRSLGLDPNRAETQALVLACQRYDLDPVLKHMILIKDQPYVTHKGLWHVAHRSGLLDGHDVLEQGETTTEWWARVSIWRKDMSRPFTMTGRYPKAGTNKQHGPEMAVTRAECLVLRRMFDVSLPAQEEQDFDLPPAPVPVQSTPVQSVGVALIERVKTAGEWHAATIKAAKGNRKVSAAAFDADLDWAAEVAAILEMVEPEPEPLAAPPNGGYAPGEEPF